MKKENETYMPILDDIQRISAGIIDEGIHPTLGVWLPSQNSEGEIKTKLWFWNGMNMSKKNLVLAEEYLSGQLYNTFIPYPSNIPKNLIRMGVWLQALLNYINSLKFDNRLSVVVQCSVYENEKQKNTLLQVKPVVEGVFLDYLKKNYTDVINQLQKKDSVVVNNSVVNVYYEIINYKYIKKIFTTLHNYTSYNYIQYIDLLLDRLHQYLEFESELDYKFIAFWAAGTYFFPLFEAFPYLYINGVKGSGKSTLLSFLKNVVFNPITSANTTASALFRIVDSALPTLLIDETDQLADKRMAPDLHNLLLNGYKIGGHVLRSEKNSKDNYGVKFFEVYCPKALVNIEGMDDVLESRTIRFHMARALSKEISRNSSKMSSDEYLPKIREYGYISQFLLWARVREIYNSIEPPNEISNRDWELWRPILVLAKLYSDDEYKAMLEYAKAKTAEKKEDDMASSDDMVVFSAVENAYISSGGNNRWITVSDIIRNLDVIEEDRKYWGSRRIGRIMKRLGFNHKRRMSYGIEYYITRTDVKSIGERLGAESRLPPPSSPSTSGNEPGQPASNPRDNLLSELRDRGEMPRSEAELKYGKELIERMLNDKDIFEPKAGLIKIL